MQTERLNFYLVDTQYVENLTAADNRVMSVSPTEHNESRQLVGIVIEAGGKRYCVPITSAKEKHRNMKNDVDFSRILDKHGSVIGALNFNNMIPVDESLITLMDIHVYEGDENADAQRKQLMNNQLDWCNDNRETIIHKANRLYDLITKTPEKSINLARRCCDFKKLEQVLDNVLAESKSAKDEKTP